MPPRKRKSTTSSSRSRSAPELAPALVKRPRTRLYKKQNPLHIDHLSFPHIIDSILEYGGWAVQIKFRATCKAFRYRVDSQVAKHIVVRADERFAYSTSPNRRIISFHSPEGPIRGFQAMKEQQLLDIATSRRNKDRWLRAIFQHVEVLDIVMNVPLPVRTVLGSLASAPRLVRYVRRYHAPNSELERSDFFTKVQAPTVVLYPGMRLKHNDAGQHSPAFTRLDVPEGPMQRLVIQHHFRRYQSLNHQRQYYVVSSKRQALKEIVVLFSLPDPDVNNQPINWDGHVMQNRNSLFTMICGLALDQHPDTKLTFVGLESIPPCDFDFRPGTPFETVKEHLALGVRAKATRQTWYPLKPENVDATLNKIRYLTLEEYRAEIGETQFKAEMDASPPPPPASEQQVQVKK